MRSNGFQERPLCMLWWWQFSALQSNGLERRGTRLRDLQVSPGCDRCRYAERITQRFPRHFQTASISRCGLMHLTTFRCTGNLAAQCLREFNVGSLSRRRAGKLHQPRVFDVMRRCARSTFQVLTKRAGRLVRTASRLPTWPPNVWMGVSVESPAYIWRISYLRQTPAAVRFISAEPLHEACLN